jgi:hypothetical protein
MKTFVKFSITLYIILFACQWLHAQNEILINDVYYERMFKRIVINSAPASKTTTDMADIYGQRTKYGVEGTILNKKYPAFGAISEQKLKGRVNWNFGYMLYKMPPIDTIPGSEKIGQLGSLGFSLYTRYVKVYTGVLGRYGNNPQVITVADSSYFKENAEARIYPFLYLDYPGKNVLFSGSVTPSHDFKSISRAGVMLGLRYLKIKNENYTDAMKTPNGYDYDSGTELKYIFESPLEECDKFYARVRFGKAFSVNTDLGQSFADGMKNKDNNYLLAEMAYFYVAGISYHNTAGLGWRFGLDYGTDRITVILSYQSHYVMPTTFANQPDVKGWYLSLIVN